MKQKRLIGFDLDGTLTQHKSPLCEQNRHVLEKLSERYHLVMVGAGACERIYKQLGEFPIDIIGNYGMQRSEIKNGKLKLVENHSCPVDREKLNGIAQTLRDQFHLDTLYGDIMEFHASGVLTFPLLGTKAPLPEKLSCDPDRSKRRAMFREVCKAFEGYTVFIGGSSSFDLTPPGYDKFHALQRFCTLKGFTLEETIYVGDDFGEGGNDSQVKAGGIDIVEIKDYRNFPQKMEFLLS